MDTPGSSTNVAVLSGPQREVERLIEKGRIKDAFKQAKQNLHKENSPENRHQVERTYLLRVEELARGGMHSAAAEVARSFLEFGVNDPAILESLVLILPRIGMANQALALGGRIGSPEAQASLALKIADEAILHPAQAASATADVRAGAERIRAALTAVEQSRDAEALELLKEIPRNSPWADWRYFVRGLIAWYKQEEAQTTENWSRLDPQRPASSIATVLKRMHGTPGPVNRDAKSGPDLSQLEMAVFGNPLLAWIAELQQHIDHSSYRGVDWPKALRRLGPLSKGLKKVDPRLADRLTELLLPVAMEAASRLSFERGSKLLKDFMAAAEPLAIDPHWNRGWALMWERDEYGVGKASEHWQKYLEDIAQLTTLSEQERRRLQALVWRHLAELRYERSGIPEGITPQNFKLEDLQRGPSARQVQPVIDALEESLRFDPQQATYDMLIDVHGNSGQRDQQAEAARRCVAAFPDDLEALKLLIDHHRRTDEAEKMLVYVEKLRAVRPLEPSLVGNEFWARIGLARNLALEGKFAEGWAELARAEELMPESADNYRMLARRAVFKYKAGETAAAEEFLNRARSKLAEPTAVWLALDIDAVRYDLPLSLERTFQEALKVALKKTPTAQTAGTLAEILGAIAYFGIEYPGNDKHVSLVRAYLKRITARIPMDEPNLRQVCVYLASLNSDPAVVKKLVNRGKKSFPQAPIYHSLSADIEMQRGPMRCSLNTVKKHLRTALRLAEASTEPADQALVPHLKERLLTTEDMQQSMSSLPPMGGGFGPGMNMQDMFRELMKRVQNGELDLDDELDDGLGDDFFFGPPPPPSPRGPRKRK